MFGRIIAAQYLNIYTHPYLQFLLLICGSELLQLNRVNIMATDALAPCVARISAPMILKM